jgi:hypothetical protein
VCVCRCYKLKVVISSMVVQWQLSELQREGAGGAWGSHECCKGWELELQAMLSKPKLDSYSLASHHKLSSKQCISNKKEK